MRADEVARFLQDNPRFFDDHADLLSHIYLPHPHGGRAVSITERQVVSLRDKTRQLEGKLAELIRFGEENDAIADKVHRLALALIGAADAHAVLQLAQMHLRDDFAVPHIALRVWDEALQRGDGECQVSETARRLIAELPRPYCGPAASIDASSWFAGIEPPVRSLALVPLRADSRTIGALALGSEDVKRFYPEMGTLYLERIGELLSEALLRRTA